MSVIYILTTLFGQ